MPLTGYAGQSRTGAMYEQLSLGELESGVHDLLTKRLALLESSKSGMLYKEAFEQQLKELKVLPEPSKSLRSLTAELKTADQRHDSYGRAAHYLIMALLEHPDVPEHHKTELREIQAQFIPSLEVLNDKYVAEALTAKKNEEKLRTFKPKLMHFTLGDHGSLFSWVSSFIDAGKGLQTLLDNRSKTATGSRETVGPLRADIIATLGEFRTALSRELRTNPSLPRDLLTKVFAYFDQMSEMNPKSSGTSQSEADPSKNPTEPEQTG